MDGVIVKHSKIHGKGVFAARDFKEGEVVTKWDTSKTITEDQLKKASTEEKKYITKMGDRIVVMQEPEKYVNHSCNPNTKVRNLCDVALRDIKKGEEITGNYLEEGSLEVPFVCNCRSHNCKIKIGD